MRYYCFNSATTFQPWKRPASATGNFSPMGFNSATTFQPWKRRSNDRPHRHICASIRPRPFSRGNLHPKSQLWQSHRKCFNSATTFQPWKPFIYDWMGGMEYCFNTATTFQPWKRSALGSYLPCITSLQFGHDLSAVETIHGTMAPLRGWAASIRPRPFSRGNDSAITGTHCRHAASIRPRPFSRGNPIVEKFNFPPTWSLQFGHDLSAVETRSWNNGSHTKTACFNSATTFQPWKHQCEPYRPDNLSRASIRPRPFSRGNLVRPCKIARRLPTASIRPRPFSRGNVSSDHHPNHHRIASIRPRPFSRGNSLYLALVRQ